MNILTRRTFGYFFKSLCVVVVAIMVTYWIYKFKIEDRDIGVVDIVPLDGHHDVKLPVASLCFDSPFLKERLKSIDPEMNSTLYKQYLKGEVFDARYQDIEYNNVTMNLQDYFLYGQIKLSNETQFRNNSFKFNHKTIFSGLYYWGKFIKCFAIEMENTDLRNVNWIKLFYDKQKIISDLMSLSRSSISMLLNLHYPGQFLLEVNNVKYAPINNEKSGYEAAVRSEEVLKGRNSYNRKCFSNHGSYDDMVLVKHIESKGCRTPYQIPYKEFPVCDTKEKIKSSMYKFDEARKRFPKACERIANLDFNLFVKKFIDNDTWMFVMTYPEDIKLISQSKEIDGHALLGNIGGYIGLFVGKKRQLKF